MNSTHACIQAFCATSGNFLGSILTVLFMALASFVLARIKENKVLFWMAIIAIAADIGWTYLKYDQFLKNACS